LDGDEQHDEAHLLAASVLKGVAGIDGAMVELLTVVHRKERKEKGEMAVARWEERGGARVSTALGRGFKGGSWYGVGFLTMTSAKGKRGACSLRAGSRKATRAERRIKGYWARRWAELREREKGNGLSGRFGVQGG
jgi:hypothetical protein